MTDEAAGASVQDVLGAAGECPSFTWRGETYRVGFPTQRAKARLEELIAAAETAAVQSLKGVVPPADYQDALARLGRQLRKREQRTRDGELWRKYLAGEESATGFLLYLLALLRENHPGLTEDDVSQMLAGSGEFVLLAADRVVPGFFSMLGGEMGLPREAVAVAVERTRAALRSRPTPSGTTP